MSQTLTIRAADPGDLSALDRLFTTTYPKLLKADYPPSVLVTALPLISRAQPKLLQTGTFFVAELDGAIVGAGGWTPWRRSDVGEVRHVVTDFRQLRRGIGRAIFRRIFEQVEAAGLRVLNCQATRTAVPFYQALGFVPLGPIEIPLRAGISFPAIQMQRRMR